MAVRSFFIYVPRESPIHRLHPLAKLVMLVAVNVVALVIEAPIGFLVAIALILVGFKVAGIPIARLARFLVLIFLVMQGVMVSYILASRIPGNIVLWRTPWGTYVSDMTLLYAFSMVLRFFTMLVGSTLVLASTRDRDIVYGLTSIGVPYPVCFVLNLAFRTMSVFLDDFFKVRDAMILRGTDFSKGSIVERVRKYVYMGVPLALLTIRKDNRDEPSRRDQGVQA